MVVNLDLRDFFPTVTYRRVKGLFRALGYSEQQATVLGLVCTEPEVDEVELDGRRWFVVKGERHLPQGAPTSPALTNLLCRRLDARMAGIARSLDYTYTRYADDLSFSASGESARHVRKLLWRVRAVVEDEGFEIHPDKLRIMRTGQRKEVTGIVVNQRPAICRKTLRRFRAVLRQVELDGPEGKHWNGNDNVLAALRGFACFIHMVDPAKGAPAMSRVEALLRKHGWKQEVRHPRKASVPKPADASRSPELPNPGDTGKTPWWKRLFQK